LLVGLSAWAGDRSKPSPWQKVKPGGSDVRSVAFCHVCRLCHDPAAPLDCRHAGLEAAFCLALRRQEIRRFLKIFVAVIRWKERGFWAVDSAGAGGLIMRFA
jgi:hypothetical protein